MEHLFYIKVKIKQKNTFLEDADAVAGSLDAALVSMGAAAATFSLFSTSGFVSSSSSCFFLKSIKVSTISYIVRTSSFHRPKHVLNDSNDYYRKKLISGKNFRDKKEPDIFLFFLNFEFKKSIIKVFL